MNKTLTVLTLAAGLALTGCQAVPDNPTASETTYSGVLPCADCAGIRTTLTLYRDASAHPSRYEMQMDYLGNPQHQTSYTTKGSWTIDSTRINNSRYPLFVLKPGNGDQPMQFVHNAGNAVEMVGADGKPAASGLNYTLIRQ